MESAGGRGGIVGSVAAVSLAVGAIALLWGASEDHYRSCVEAASARYPPIAVSAFTGEQTGPLKVAYDAERTRAVDDCRHVPW